MVAADHPVGDIDSGAMERLARGFVFAVICAGVTKNYMEITFCIDEPV
jgi:hypothetical protein